MAYFKTNTWKIANQSSGYRIQNYTYTSSVAATTGFPNTWDAATNLDSYSMGSTTEAQIKFHSSNIVIAMNEYVPTCHYAALDITHFNALTKKLTLDTRAKLIADANYNTPAKACGMLAKLKVEAYGWLEAAYSDDVTATISTANATMDSLFCTSTAGLDTYAKFDAQNLYSSADFMQVINVSRHKKVANTTTDLPKIVVGDFAAGLTVIKDERARVFLLSHSLRDLRKKAGATGTDITNRDLIFPCPLQLLQLAHPKYDNKVLYVNDALINKDTSANRFMYHAIYTSKTYYPGVAYDASTLLKKDDQTNDTLGGTAAAGQWKDNAIADAKFGIMLGKLVERIHNDARIKSAKTSAAIYYGELDLFGITADIILKAGWNKATLIKVVEACRAKVVSNATVTITDAMVSGIKYNDHVSGTKDQALTAANITSYKISPEMVAGLQITQLDATYKVRTSNAWTYTFASTKTDDSTKLTSSDFWAFRMNFALSDLSVDRNAYNNISYMADKMLASIIGDTKTPKVNKFCGYVWNKTFVEAVMTSEFGTTAADKITKGNLFDLSSANSDDNRSKTAKELRRFV